MVLESQLKQAEEKMKKAVGVTREELALIRTGRASPKLVEKLEIDFYGTKTPLVQLAGITVPDARTLAIQPYDRNSIAAIEKAILSSDLGLNPTNDGNLIRLSFPTLTEERRKELIKIVHHRAEEGRVAVRNVRRHSKEEMERQKKDGTISEDDLKRSERDLQKLTDQFVGEIDHVMADKEKELSEL